MESPKSWAALAMVATTVCLEHGLPEMEGHSGRLGVLGKRTPKRASWRLTAQDGQSSVEVSFGALLLVPHVHVWDLRTPNPSVSVVDVTKRMVTMPLSQEM